MPEEWLIFDIYLGYSDAINISSRARNYGTRAVFHHSTRFNTTGKAPTVLLALVAHEYFRGCVRLILLSSRSVGM